MIFAPDLVKAPEETTSTILENILRLRLCRAETYSKPHLATEKAPLPATGSTIRLSRVAFLAHWWFERLQLSLVVHSRNGCQHMNKIYTATTTKHQSLEKYRLFDTCAPTKCTLVEPNTSFIIIFWACLYLQKPSIINNQTLTHTHTILRSCRVEYLMVHHGWAQLVSSASRGQDEGAATQREIFQFWETDGMCTEYVENCRHISYESYEPLRFLGAVNHSLGMTQPSWKKAAYLGRRQRT